MKLYFLRLFGLLVFITYISNNPYKISKMSFNQEDLLLEIYHEIEKKGLRKKFNLQIGKMKKQKKNQYKTISNVLCGDV